VAFVGFNLEKARKFREQLELIAPFAEAKRPFEEDVRRFLEVTRERLQQSLGQECWNQLTVTGELFEVGFTEWGGVWQAFTDARLIRLPAVSHCIWWGLYAARGSGDLFAYWGIEPRSERILTQYGSAFEQMATKLALEVRKIRPDLAMYWGRVGGVRLEEWKDLQGLLLDRAGKLLAELTGIPP
jgi:hypothetical protein